MSGAGVSWSTYSANSASGNIRCWTCTAKSRPSCCMTFKLSLCLSDIQCCKCSVP